MVVSLSETGEVVLSCRGVLEDFWDEGGDGDGSESAREENGESE